MKCILCGGESFGLGPGGRLSASQKNPRCEKCQSLERHRAIRHRINAIRTHIDLSTRSCLQFSRDHSVDPAWFRSHELSVYGGPNSIDLQAIDRPDGSYDVIVCNHVIEHVEDDRKAIAELVRVTSPEGFIFLTTPMPIRLVETRDWGYPDWNQHGHYRLYGMDILRKFQAVAPEAMVLVAPMEDDVTGDKDMAFLLTKSPKTAQTLVQGIG